MLDRIIERLTAHGHSATAVCGLVTVGVALIRETWWHDALLIANCTTLVVCAVGGYRAELARRSVDKHTNWKD